MEEDWLDFSTVVDIQISETPFFLCHASCAIFLCHASCAMPVRDTRAKSWGGRVVG